LILEEQNTFKIIGTWAEQFSGMGNFAMTIRGSTFPGKMHNYIWCPYYLPSFMKFCLVVSEELYADKLLQKYIWGNF
jgi:hypothetical protein